MPWRNTEFFAAAGWASGGSPAVTCCTLGVGTPSREMEKRIFIAVLISIAFLWLWAAVAPKLFPDLVKPKTNVTAPKPAPEKTATTASTGTVPAASGTPGQVTFVTTTLSGPNNVQIWVSGSVQDTQKHCVDGA